MAGLMRGKSLQEEQTELLYESLPNSLGTSFFIGAILAWMQSAAVSLANIGLWIAIFVIVLIARAFLLYQYRQLSDNSIGNKPDWLQRFRYGALAAGCSWGIASFFLFVADNPFHHLILSFALAGVTAGAVTSLAVDRTSALYFIVPALSALLLRFITSGEPHSLQISIMILLFMAFLVATTYRSQRLMDIQARLKVQQELDSQQGLGKAIVNSQAKFISEDNPHIAFDLLLDEILSLTNSEYGFIGEILFKKDNTPYLKTYAITNIAWNDETRAFYDEKAPQGLEFYNLDTLFGEAIKKQEIVIANKPGQDPRRGGLPEGHPPLNAFLGIPIFSGSKMIAMVGIANRPGGYNDALVEFLRPILSSTAQLVVALTHKRVDKEIQSTIKRLSLVASQTNNGVVITNTAGEIDWVNEAFSGLSGYSLAEVIGKKPGDFLQGKDTDPDTVLTMRTSLSKLESFNVEVLNYHKNNTPYWIEINCTPFYDDAGNHQGFIAIETDITQRKEYENKITETSEFLSGVLNASSEISIIATNPEGIITVFNSGAENILGYKAEDIINIHTPALFHLKSEVVARGIELSQELGRTIEGFRVFVEVPERMGSEQREWTYVTRDGDQKTVSLVVTIMQSENGGILGYLGVAQDITLQKKSQEDIEQFKKTLDQTLDCVFIFDASKLQFYYVNQGAVEQVGYSKSELLQMHPYDLKPEFSSDEFRNFINPLINGKRNSITFETIHRHKDGHDIPVEIFLQIISPEEEQARFVAIVRDITERKRVEKLKNEFVSTVSHELRTPLTSICGSLGLIAGTSLDELSSQNRQLIEIANSNSQRLSHLINDLLDMEKIAAGKMDFVMQPELVMPQIEFAVSANQSYAEKYDVQFEIINRVDDVEINTDSQRLQQILSNLLSNAAKFSPRGGKVEIDTRLERNSVRISVIDHGQGIPKEFHDRLFDKFSQADSSDTRQKGGTGLGLAISRELTLRMHGRIGFESEEGIGTTFWVEFPVLF